MWYVYILECKNGQLYTGITTDVEQRFLDHKSGKGGHFTKKYGVKSFLYSKEFNSQILAAFREKQIKGWSRKKKFMLVSGQLI